MRVILSFLLTTFLILNTAVFSEAFEDDFEDPFDTRSSNTYASTPDPFIKFNRVMFKFNDYLYVGFVKPVSTITQAVLPNPLERGIKNVLDLIFSPLDIVNYLLQGNPKAAGKQTGRLLINATLGIGGLFDPADTIFKLPEQSTSFGYTLGVWGVGQGPYLVLPVFGPTVTRNASNSVFNFTATRLYMDEPTRNLTNGTRVITGFWAFSDTYDSIRKTSLDPYIIIREFTVNQAKIK